MAVDDHGLEVIKKSGEEVVPGSKADYYIKVGLFSDGQEVSSGNPLPVTGSSGGSTIVEPTVFNLSVPLADTEVSQLLPDKTKKIMFKNRDAGIVKFSFTSGQSGTLFMTLPPGAVYSETDLFLTGQSIYFQASLPNQTLEILTWSQP